MIIIDKDNIMIDACMLKKSQFSLVNYSKWCEYLKDKLPHISISLLQKTLEPVRAVLHETIGG